MRLPTRGDPGRHAPVRVEDLGDDQLRLGKRRLLREVDGDQGHGQGVPGANPGSAQSTIALRSRAAGPIRGRDFGSALRGATVASLRDVPGGDPGREPARAGEPAPERGTGATAPETD